MTFLRIIARYHPSLEVDNIVDLANKAYAYCRGKLILKPAVVSLDFGDGMYFDIVDTPIPTKNNKEVMFKEVFDIHSDRTDERVSFKYAVPSVVEIQNPNGIAYWDGSRLNAKGIVNVIGFLYPWLTDTGKYTLKYDDLDNPYNKALVLPVVAMMYSYLSRESGNETMAMMYESIAVKYINMHNANKVKPLLSNLTSIAKVVPHEL